MVKTNQCVKEWKATVEALGTGKQTIFIRVYPTNKNGFLLYPTKNYRKNDNYINGFKKEYQDFVEYHTNKGEDGIEIKYYANCVNVINVPINKISELDKFYIWTKDHVESYLNKRKAYVWLLRVYELEDPVTVNIASGQIYAIVNKNVDLTNMKPVLSDKEFNETVEKIKKIV
jgi:hypothetical protein